MRRDMVWIGIFFIFLALSSYLFLLVYPPLGCVMCIAAPIFLTMGVILLIFGVFRRA